MKYSKPHGHKLSDLRRFAYLHVDDCETFEQLLAECQQAFPWRTDAERRVVDEMWNDVRVRPLEDRMRRLVQQLTETEATDALIGAGDCGDVVGSLMWCEQLGAVTLYHDERRPEDIGREAEDVFGRFIQMETPGQWERKYVVPGQNTGKSAMRAGLGLELRPDPRMPPGLFALVDPSPEAQASHERFMRLADHYARRRQPTGVELQDGSLRDLRSGCDCLHPDKAPLDVCPIAFELDGDDSLCACCDDCRKACGADI